MGTNIRIAIADDHPLVISGLRHILGNRQDMEVIGSYNNGEELLGGLEDLQPNVLLLDIQMPGRTGDELAEVISAQYPDIKMLALTNLDNAYYINSMFRNGVLGYILKTSREDVLLDAIKSVYQGVRYLEPALSDKMEHGPAKQLALDPILSRREKEVLSYIAANLTSQQIADKLFVSKRTIDNHRLSLLMKLDVKNSAALIKKAIQLGLMADI